MKHVHHHRAQGIQVRPRTLPQFGGFGVLLDGGVAGFEHGREGLCAVTDGAASGAKIQQHRFARSGQENVVGRDVAVVDAFGVQGCQSVEQGIENAAQPRLGWR